MYANAGFKSSQTKIKNTDVEEFVGAYGNLFKQRKKTFQLNASYILEMSCFSLS